MLKRFLVMGFVGLVLSVFICGLICVNQCFAAKWTYAVYLDADNNLEDAGIDDFLEMAKVGSNSDINIVVQMDRASGYDSTYGDWKTCKRFKITKDMKPYASNALEDLGEANMGSPTTLTNFITWVWTNYPADRYALILWNHGGGWRDRSPSRSPLERAVCWDDGNNDDCLYMKEVRTAISNASHTFDLIGFDACLMGHLEVAYELRNVLDDANGVMVGSEETEPGDGWPHDTILSYLAANPSATPKQLGTAIVDKYGAFYGASAACTQSAIDTTKINDAVSKLNIFADSMNDNSQLTAIQTARTNCKAYSESDGYYGVDIYRFANQVGGTAATNLKTAITSAVVKNYKGSARNDTAKYGSYGLCVYFPKTKSYYDSAYTSAILYGSETTNKWDDFLKRYYDGNLGTGGGSTQTGADGSGTASLSKKGVAPNTYYTSITYTLTPTAAGSLGGGKVEVTIPSGWTAPQNTSSTGKGYVKSYIYKYQTTSYNLTTAISGQKVTITGIPSDRLAYGSGDKLKLQYKKFTTQSTEGTAKFYTKTAGSGGTLTAISKQPTITVGASYASSKSDIDEEVEAEDGSVKQAALGQNYPNPFNPATTFNYFIPEGGRVTIKLYNVAGQEVDTVVDEDQLSGEHSIKYDSGDKLSRGVYYYRLTLNGKEIGTKRAVVLK
ncbi:MAG: clostripain-related cysteine peptidase [Elusimicrobiota bacterium]